MKIILPLLFVLFASGSFSQQASTAKAKQAPAKTTAAATCKFKGCKSKAAKNGYCAAHQPVNMGAQRLPVQCSAVVKGKRCRHTTLSKNGKCYLHGGDQ